MKIKNLTKVWNKEKDVNKDQRKASAQHKRYEEQHIEKVERDNGDGAQHEQLVHRVEADAANLHGARVHGKHGATHAANNTQRDEKQRVEE